MKEFYCSRASCINKRRKESINDKELITNLWWDIHRLKHNSRRVDHPTQLPPMFMNRLISLFTNEGDIVLDPFNGSGTTSLCAAKLNRRFFGIELSEKYYKISLNRHAELENGIDPFRKQDTTPKAKNSYVQRLRKQKYEVDKKTLQLYIKDLSVKLGRIPTREDVISFNTYPIDYFDSYFINWGEVTAAARTTGMESVENKSDYKLKQQLRLFEEKQNKYGNLKKTSEEKRHD
jgi:site-specific DNA-methyltransferase (adenine-specific)